MNCLHVIPCNWHFSYHLDTRYARARPRSPRSAARGGSGRAGAFANLSLPFPSPAPAPALPAHSCPCWPTRARARRLFTALLTAVLPSSHARTPLPSLPSPPPPAHTCSHARTHAPMHTHTLMCTRHCRAATSDCPFTLKPDGALLKCSGRGTSDTCARGICDCPEGFKPPTNWVLTSGGCSGPAMHNRKTLHVCIVQDNTALACVRCAGTRLVRAFACAHAPALPCPALL